MRTAFKFITAGVFIISAIGLLGYTAILAALSLIYAFSNVSWGLLWLILSFVISFVLYVWACEPADDIEYK